MKFNVLFYLRLFFDKINTFWFYLYLVKNTIWVVFIKIEKYNIIFNFIKMIWLLSGLETGRLMRMYKRKTSIFPDFDD